MKGLLIQFAVISSEPKKNAWLKIFQADFIVLGRKR